MEHIIKPIWFRREDVTSGLRDGRMICSDDMQLQLTYILLPPTLRYLYVVSGQPELIQQ